MNVTETKKYIADGGLDGMFETLYGSSDKPKARYSGLLDGFMALYGERDNVRLFSAPGRTEVGGNHTDHQHGCVLAGSVDLDVIGAVQANGSNIIRIKSEGFDMDIVDISDLSVKKEEIGKSASLIRGVVAAFKNDGLNIGGFDAYTTSNVLKGSGLSSSAAFEVLIAKIVDNLFNGNTDAVTLAKYSQFAEREYFGKPCGLLDQMASSVGGFTYADFNDPTDPYVSKIPLDLRKSDHTLCVVDTGGNHADLTQDYADITVECRAVSEALGVEYLRDADEQRFYGELAQLRSRCGDRAVLRAFHFFNENARVGEQFKALKVSDFDKFFSLVNESGESSYKYLQNLYSCSDTSEQGLSLAIALTKKFLGGRGACRVHGGGFAGTIQCYIPNDMIDDYRTMIENVFGKGSCVTLTIRPLGGCEVK